MAPYVTLCNHPPSVTRALPPTCTADGSSAISRPGVQIRSLCAWAQGREQPLQITAETVLAEFKGLPTRQLCQAFWQLIGPGHPGAVDQDGRAGSHRWQVPGAQRVVDPVEPSFQGRFGGAPLGGELTELITTTLLVLSDKSVGQLALNGCRG